MRKSAIQLLFFLFLVKTTLFTISCSTDEGITDDDGPACFAHVGPSPLDRLRVIGD